jgi:GTP-binding protein HflX
LETDRRLLQKRVEQLQKRIEKVGVQRGQQRRARLRNTLPRVALVGYTNAGKSTLFNAITRGTVYAADQLFATLDPTVRRLDGLESGPAVLADTVGFIRELPHALVAAFRATLSEARDADLLLHVIDAADPERDVLVDVVNGVLGEIGAGEVPQLRVYNKIDLLGAAASEAMNGVEMPRKFTPRIDRDAADAPVAVWLSAASGMGLDLLQRAIGERLAGTRVHAELRLPPAAGRLRARLIELGAVKAERYDEDGWQLDIDAPRNLLLPLAGDARGDEARLLRDWLNAA